MAWATADETCATPRATSPRNFTHAGLIYVPLPSWPMLSHTWQVVWAGPGVLPYLPSRTDEQPAAAHVPSNRIGHACADIVLQRRRTGVCPAHNIYMRRLIAHAYS